MERNEIKIISEADYCITSICRNHLLDLTDNICDTYGESASSIKICEYWFKSGDIDVVDKECSILDENSAHTLKELAEVLNVNQAII